MSLRRAAVVALLVGTAVTALYGWGRDRTPFGPIEGDSLDWRFRLRGPVAPSGEVVIVAIDEASIAALGGWPLPRSVLAAAVRRLDEAGARVVAIDLLLLELEQATISGEPGPGDLALAAASGVATVILPFVFGFEPGGNSPPIPAAVKAAALPLQHWTDDPQSAALPHPALLLAPPTALLEHANTAHATVVLEVDGSLRHLQLVLPYKGALYPALPLEAARLQLGLARSDILVESGRGIRLGRTFVASSPALQLAVNYYGPPGTIPTVPMTDLLAGRVNPNQFAGKLVLIGATASGLGDRFAAPFSRVYPGVEFFATAADNLLTHRWLRRGEDAAAIDIAAIVLGAVAAASIGMALPAAWAALGLAGVSALWMGTATLALIARGAWLNLAFPLLALWLGGGAAILIRAAAESRLRRTAEVERGNLARYVPEAIADELARSERPRFDERTQPASVLFIDLAGFTGTAETMEGGAMLKLVRRFQGLIERSVADHRGIIDKYVGDGAMVLFGLPEPVADDPARAVACALALAAAVESWNGERSGQGEAPLRVGIGIHHGPVVVARIGDRRAQVTAMGDAVNVASRLEHMTREIGGVIVVSQAVAAALQALGRSDLMQGFSYLGERPVRGRSQGVGIWRWPADPA